jgi:RNA polymerase sigma-70 factor (ECF subfamily)
MMDAWRASAHPRDFTAMTVILDSLLQPWVEGPAPVCMPPMGHTAQIPGGRVCMSVTSMPTQNTQRQWFERVVADNYRLFYSVALSIVRKPPTAEDVVQEGLVRACRNLATLQDPARIVSWMVQIVRNAALDEVRRRKVETVDLVDSPLEPVDHTRPQLDTDSRKILLDAIGTLSDGLAEVVILRFFDGLGLVDIAKRLGIERNTVGVRLFRALAHLRKLPGVQGLSEDGAP